MAERRSVGPSFLGSFEFETPRRSISPFGAEAVSAAAAAAPPPMPNPIILLLDELPEGLESGAKGFFSAFNPPPPPLRFYPPYPKRFPSPMLIFRVIFSPLLMAKFEMEELETLIRYLSIPLSTL